MLIRLVWVGRTKDPGAAAMIEDYRRRISRFCTLEIVEVRDAAGKGAARAARESRDLERTIAGKGLVAALDEGGRTLSSREFAAWLGRAAEERGEVSFLLGGSEGLDAGLTNSAAETLSLSRMTFTHEMARAILMEQIYRAFTILKGTPYHR